MLFRSGHVAIGRDTLYNNTTGTNNFAIGKSALITNQTGSNNVVIGNAAGVYETNSNNFYINNGNDFGNQNNEKSGSLMYGKFDSSLTNQFVQVNGTLKVNSGSLYINSSSAFPSATGSGLLSWDASTGQISNTSYQNALASINQVGCFYNTGSVTTSANVQSVFTYTTTQISADINVTNNSRINIPKAGTYNFQFSIQIYQGSAAATINVWLKKNGSNIANTNSQITVGSNSSQLMALNLWDSASANDYYELAYVSSSSNTQFTTLAGFGYPNAPQIIMTVNQVR